MKPTLSLLLLAMAYLCHKAEKKSSKWYDDRLLLRLQGAFIATSALLWLV